MTGPHYMPPWATRPVDLCPDCRRHRRQGERHSMGDLDHEGEVVAVTCLDGAGEVLLPPAPWAPSLPGESRYPDPWYTPSDEPPPF